MLNSPACTTNKILPIYVRKNLYGKLTCMVSLPFIVSITIYQERFRTTLQLSTTMMTSEFRNIQVAFVIFVLWYNYNYPVMFLPYASAVAVSAQHYNQKLWKKTAESILFTFYSCKETVLCVFVRSLCVSAFCRAACCLADFCRAELFFFSSRMWYSP